MVASGKGFFIWVVSNCEGGDASAIASAAANAGFSHALVKIADGESSYNVTSQGVDLAAQVVNALHNKGIEAWGWHYIYGHEPIAEADKAIRRVNDLGVDAYVIDAEAEFKQSGMDEAASQFMSRLRSSLPDFPVILCSYRYPTYHSLFPWANFLEKCDYNMPQVYWIGAHNPGEQLIRSVREFQNLTPFRPMLATGATFKEGDWEPTVSDVNEFMDTVQDLNISAVNYWEWSHCRKTLPDLWTAISNYSFAATTPVQDITQQYVAALNSHDSNQVLNFYNNYAVHVTASRTIQGLEAIRTWYNAFFTQILPNATFTLTSYSGSGNTRHLTWTATSSLGKVNDGSDTIGLVNNKIVYHYTQFSLS